MSGNATSDTLVYPAGSNRVANVVRGGQTIRSFTYDAAGNLTADNGSGGNKAYVYNNRNRLSQATVGALVYNYTYNALEQLVIRAQVSPAATTHFIHDRMGNVIAETAGGGPTGTTGTVREYIWLPETEIAPTMASRTVVDRPMAVVDNVNTASPVTYWVSVDHLNRPVKMTNAAKASVWDATWLPWGGVQAITGTATLNARFPGQWFQSETGLHYNWHRSYDPTLGRYTQPDPLGFVDGPSVYGYAKGSPEQWIDRDGRIASPYPQSKPPSDIKKCGIVSTVCRWVVRFIPAVTLPTQLAKWVLVWECGGLEDGGKNGGPEVTIRERDGDTVIASFEGAGGRAEIIANVKRDGDTIILDGAHIQGGGTIREAIEAARNWGREQGASTVIIQGGPRTTGANPGHIPRPITVKITP